MARLETRHDHSANPRATRDSFVALTLWIFAGILLGITLVRRCVSSFRAWLRSRGAKAQWTPLTAPWRTTNSNLFARFFARLGHILLHGRLGWRGPLGWLSPPPLGRCLLVVAWWALCAVLAQINVNASGLDRLELLGFRSGWIALVQTPLIFLLVSRANVLGLLAGISHERLNWMHRWVARTFVLVVTVHAAFFTIEWIQADYFLETVRAQAHVQYGLASWLLFIWIGLSSLAPVRALAYEVFVFNHVSSAVLSMVLLAWHLPSQHRWSVWIALITLASDWLCSMMRWAWQNLNRGASPTSPRLGFEATLTPVGKDVTAVHIRAVPFSWHAGQHVLLWAPRFWLQSAHPFSIVNPPSPGRRRDMHIIMRTKMGFTRKLNSFARRPDDGSSRTIRVLLSGPYGTRPPCQDLETVMLISASTGASYSMALLESLVSGESHSVRQVHVLLVARSRSHIECYLGRIHDLIEAIPSANMSIYVRVAVTGNSADHASSLESDADKACEAETAPLVSHAAAPGEDAHPRAQSCDSRDEKAHVSEADDTHQPSLDPPSGSRCSTPDPGPDPDSDSDPGLFFRDEEEGLAMDECKPCSFELTETVGRPDVEKHMDDVFQSAAGRVGVFVCGGRDVTAATRRALDLVLNRRGSQFVANVRFHAEKFDQ